MRSAAEIIEMTFRNDFVQIRDAVLLRRQQNDVISVADCASGQCSVDFVESGYALFPCRIEHTVEHVRRCPRIVYGSVRIFQADAQRFANRAQSVALQARIHPSGEFQRINDRHVDFDAQPTAFLRQKRIVKLRIMRRERRPADEFQQLRNLDLCRICVRNHGVRDMRQLGNLLRNRLHRVDKSAVFLDHLTISDAHRADFHNAAFARVQSCRFKRLNHAVIGNRDGGMSPLCRTLDKVACRGNAVHLAHVGVHMQLDALALGGILTHGLFALVDVVDHHHQTAFKAVHLHVAANREPPAFFDCGDDVVHRLLFFLRRWAVIILLCAAIAAAARLIAQKRLALDGIRIIRQREGKQLHFAAAQLACFHRQHFAADGQLAGFLGQLADGQRFRRNRASENRLRLFLDRLGFLHGDLLLLLLDHLGDCLFILNLASAPNFLKLFLSQLDRLKRDMHLRDKHVLNQLFDILTHTGLRQELRRDILRHKHRQHIALALQRRFSEKRRAGGMMAFDTAHDERRVLLRVSEKILSKLGRTNNQFHPHRREIPPQCTLHA